MKTHSTWLFAVLVLLWATMAFANDYNVDCSNPTPPSGTYNSVSAVVPLLLPGDTVFISGTCNEVLYLHGLKDITIGASRATIQGGIQILTSTNIYLYGLDVMANPWGDGIYVAWSRDIYLDNCTSNGNAGAGLSVDLISDTTVVSTGAFDNNGNYGIYAGNNALVGLFAFSAPMEINNNTSGGIRVNGANLVNYGNLSIKSNRAVPDSPDLTGFGIDMRAASRAQFGPIFGNNVISGNDLGGVSLMEGSEISLWGGNLIGNPDALNVIENNGSVGVVVGFGSQATFFEGARVTGHTDAGVDVYAHSQAYLNGDIRIQGNATGTTQGRAGLRVDGNSEAYIRGGQITQNGGPGILALTSSTLDLSNLFFGQNSGGGIVCDSTSYMASDLTNSQANPSSGVVCRTPHNYGPHRTYNMAAPHAPDMTKMKAKHEYVKKLVAAHQKKS